jgi:hypothetical protein
LTALRIHHKTSYRYSADEWTDLGALTSPQYPDAAERLLYWARGFIRSRDCSRWLRAPDSDVSPPGSDPRPGYAECYQ